ncbi:unnamed protein product, partial [Didymodactylos carnosus]
LIIVLLLRSNGGDCYSTNDNSDALRITQSSTDGDFEQFGWNLYRELIKSTSTENIFFSPASISVVLSMTAAGANGTTLKEMLTTLNVSTINDMTVRAHKIASIIESSDSNEIKLKLANKIFIQMHFNISQTYKSLLEQEYLSSITSVDYKTRPVEATSQINQWVEKQTNNLIKGLLSPHDVTSATKLILVNCIYFKGKNIF